MDFTSDVTFPDKKVSYHDDEEKAALRHIGGVILRQRAEHAVAIWNALLDGKRVAAIGHYGEKHISEFVGGVLMVQCNVGGFTPREPMQLRDKMQLSDCLMELLDGDYEILSNERDVFENPLRGDEVFSVDKQHGYEVRAVEEGHVIAVEVPLKMARHEPLRLLPLDAWKKLADVGYVVSDRKEYRGD